MVQINAYSRPPHQQTPNTGSKTVQAFIEKNLHVSGPAQFKLRLFEGQLYNKVRKRTM